MQNHYFSTQFSLHFPPIFLNYHVLTHSQWHALYLLSRAYYTPRIHKIRWMSFTAKILCLPLFVGHIAILILGTYRKPVYILINYRAVVHISLST